MIINKTPHPVHIVHDGKVIRTYPSEGSIRLKNVSKLIGTIDDIPIVQNSFGEVEGIPEEHSDIFYIVSQMVLDALPDRVDLLVPSDIVRDESGNIIGCKSLGCKIPRL